MEEILKNLAEEVSEIEAIFVVDEEGIVVYNYVKESKIDGEELAVQLAHPLNRIMEALQDATNENESLEELILFTKDHLILAFSLVNDTYLIAISKRTPTYGKVRFKVKLKLEQIAQAI